MSASSGADHQSAELRWSRPGLQPGMAILEATTLDDLRPTDAFGPARGLVFGLIGALACWVAIGTSCWHLIGS